ncbi:hypothetical protein O1L55_39410 [Streptomyces albulus]|nr:hypothetical protein [Streptomyces noursei]
MIAVASELWSTLAGSMQHVAAYAYAEPPEITARVRAAAGCTARWPGRAPDRGRRRRRVPPAHRRLHVYPDFEPLRSAWRPAASPTRRPWPAPSSTGPASSSSVATCSATTRRRSA